VAVAEIVVVVAETAVVTEIEVAAGTVVVAGAGKQVQLAAVVVGTVEGEACAVVEVSGSPLPHRTDC